MLYNVLLYLRCSAETAKINLMVFLVMLYYVVEPKSRVAGIPLESSLEYVEF